MQIVLVGIDTDRQDVAVGGGLQHPDTGASGCRKDHVGPLTDLRQRQFGPFHRIIPRRRCRAGHVCDHGCFGVHSHDALGIATGEFADQRDVHAAHKGHCAGFGCHRRHHTDQIRPFVFVEHDGPHVWRINHHVDDAEFGVGVIGCNLGQGGGPRKACHHNRVRARFGKAADRLFALRIGLDFNLGIGAASFSLPTLGPVIGAFVKGFVEFAAQIEQDRGAACRCNFGLLRSLRVDIGAHSNDDNGGRAQQFLDSSHGFLPSRLRSLTGCAPAPSVDYRADHRRAIAR